MACCFWVFFLLEKRIPSENQLDFPVIVLCCTLLQVWISCIKPGKLNSTGSQQPKGCVFASDNCSTFNITYSKIIEESSTFNVECDGLGHSPLRA